ncbi:hypothetical protein TraAM80_00783 [Trypanosoma rangeli]|uniref:Uncharacterized protein n=1 Tax=Trypanosoma rangeli TaxID=5698 RepID=A0A422P1X6_TRYRA|nr:uncharacterized protein TraAM80_00783 [Trypanosoma rangeli]RNF11699.1 hypothetical protein TraAM80_00783 [Trypanosoma rangeli]|eukprot:RNF11699.1 hypothetical protein TraAM80_00783 [Trypanosoma rangeli]
MLRWFTLRLLPQKGFNLDPRRLPCRPEGLSRHVLRRGMLLAELDRIPDDAGSVAKTKANDVVNVAPLTPSFASASASSSAPHSDDYLVPSPCAKKLEEASMALDASLKRTFSVSGHSCEVNAGAPFASLDTLRAQQTALRALFADAKRRSIRMRKDRRWLREERRAFQQSHGHAPSNKEVSPFVDVELSPVAALKLAKHLSQHSSARETVIQNILLQQSVTRSRLVQSGEKTLFRCLRCFRVYAAHPRTLLRDEVGHSWMQYEAERNKVGMSRELARCPRLRKRKYSVGQQRKALAEDPRCCPSCGSPKAQWFMEYVHHSTHA